MEVNEIAYPEYSYKESEKTLEELKWLENKSCKKKDTLRDTMHKIEGLVKYRNLWNKPIGIELLKLIDKGIKILYEKYAENVRIDNLILECDSYPKGECRLIYMDNISKQIILMLKEEISQIDELQKEANSLLYRCVYLNSKAA